MLLRGPGHGASSRKRQMLPLRKDIQMIFQDPYSSLNPRHTVGTIVGIPLRVHNVVPKNKVLDRVRELLEVVGLNPEHYNRYPNEFSGGQRQRIGIARALALQPEAARGRRAGLRARRVDPGAGGQPAPGRAAGVRHRLPLHRPRPGRGPALLSRGRGDVPRQDRRDRRPRLALQPRRAPLHAGAAVRGARREAGGHRRPSRADPARPATCPARSTRPRAAGSARAASWPRTSAPGTSRR